jgi:hypothetical protein
MTRTAMRLAVGGLMTAVLAGCKSTPKVPPEKADMLSMLLPREIKIQPFTKIKSFDADPVPDGIAVVLRPTDRFGDPVKVVGHLYFELYAYKKASGERKGERLEFWERTIATSEDQRLYWDRTAQMYEFPLVWTQGAPPAPNRKYILTATYRAPWDETFQDEYVLEFALSKAEAAKATTRPRAR